MQEGVKPLGLHTRHTIMKILALSDRVLEHIYSPQIRQHYGDVDLVIGCGDLPYYYLEHVVSTLDKPTLYIHGNHDAGVQYTSDGRTLTSPAGCDSLEDRILYIDGLLVMGLGGSIRYKPGAQHQYTEAQMRTRLIRMLPTLLFNRLRHGRFVDILVTHSSPYRIHDKTDRAHIGFKTFLTLMSIFKPRYLLHGHSHVWRNTDTTQTYYRNTNVLNVFPSRLVELDSQENR